MKGFLDYIGENTTANMAYATKDFQVDAVPTEFDVGDYPDDNTEMRRWEVGNAEEAEARRETVLKWLVAAGGNRPESVTKKSIPMVPKWQSRKR